MVDVMLIVLVIIIMLVVLLVLSPGATGGTAGGGIAGISSNTVRTRGVRMFNQRWVPLNAFLAQYEYIGYYKDKSLRALPVKIRTIDKIDKMVKGMEGNALPEFVGFQYYRDGIVDVFFGDADARYNRYGRATGKPTKVGGVYYGGPWANAIYRLR